MKPQDTASSSPKEPRKRKPKTRKAYARPLSNAPFSQGVDKLQAGKKMRLNKLIALEGTYSRRQADQLIAEGHVRVNGDVVKALGIQVYPQNSRITVKGKPLELARVRYRYVMLYKPAGCITTRSDEKERRTIYEALPEEFTRYDPVGRLDRKSTGLLLLTNDGELLHRLTHPSFHLSKRYQVELNKTISNPDELANTLLDGVPFKEEGVTAKVEEVWQLGPTTLQLRLITGYNRQIRRMLEACGYEVIKLKRLSFGPLTLGNLKPGQHRFLKPAEVERLKREVSN